MSETLRTDDFFDETVKGLKADKHDEVYTYHHIIGFATMYAAYCLRKANGENKEHSEALHLRGVVPSTLKPNPVDYGWHLSIGEDGIDGKSGFMFEGQEENYRQALKEWESSF